MRYICVHGHFYQPPRENPWLEAIELQDSAYPYHDWNERVTAECYATNAAARLLDSNQHITRMMNNYSSISFDFGPTLLSWLETSAPKTYQSILDADKLSAEKFPGHGSAMAQAYNHMILPLANRRDKVTQVKWGIADFQHRFGRAPEGMWLPETAVDTETLEVLAEHGVKFTILAPRQASRIRRFGSRTWKDVSGDKIDPSRAYLARLPSRRTIALFFYDGPISQGVAFEGLLTDGQRFAERLLSGFSESRTWPQLCHIATDGESYGHHHAFGEMALAYALEHIESKKLAEFTNYGQFLQRNPADHFVELFQNSSWSCIHGVERWRGNCGCSSGGHAGWNQEWRAPLRSALDWLRDALAPIYEKKAGALLKDPWKAKDEYIRVILDRSQENVKCFLDEHAARALNPEEIVAALKLLEMQRHALLMYTSCGWFFDELSGLKTVQVFQYAARAVQLGQEIFGDHLEVEFLDRLRLAKSNLPEHQDGAAIYEKWVKPAMIGTAQVAAHYAISSLFESYRDRTQIYCYDVQREDFHIETEGKMYLAVGRAQFSSQITRESSRISFAVLHMGDHNFFCGVRAFQENGETEHLNGLLTAAFSKADTVEVIRLLDEGYGKKVYSLRSLFRDEQRKILRLILNETLTDTEATYRSMYEKRAQLIHFLNDIQVPIPKALRSAAEIALNSQLRQAFRNPEVDVDSVRRLLKEASSIHGDLDKTTLEFSIRTRIEEVAAEFASHPGDLGALEKLMVHTRWTLPNTAHERAVVGFLEAILEPAGGNPFLNDFLKFQRKVAAYGMLNGLAQVLVKMTSPGVPDFYQGCELWDLRLVDPDNRGPVDFTLRAAFLDEIEKRSERDPLHFGRELAQNWHDGRIKLYLIWRILNLRRRHPRLFLDGQFLPMKVIGKRKSNVIVYARRKGNTWMVTLAPRWLARLKASLTSSGLRAFWLGSRVVLPSGSPDSWMNVLSGESVKISRLRGRPSLYLRDIFKNFPVAVLSGVSGSSRTMKDRA